jgi:hypothetical protein
MLIERGIIVEDKAKEKKDIEDLNRLNQKKKKNKSRLDLEYLDWIFDKEFLRTKK